MANSNYIIVTVGSSMLEVEKGLYGENNTQDYKEFKKYLKGKPNSYNDKERKEKWEFFRQEFVENMVSNLESKNLLFLHYSQLY